MKKLSKIFALVFAVLCLSVGLVACNEKTGVFNYDNCYKAYNQTYTMKTVGSALNEYVTAGDDKSGTLLVKAVGADTAAKLYENRNNYYTNGGFIATKAGSTAGTIDANATVIVIRYKSNEASKQIDGIKNQLYGNYYSNITATTMQGTSSTPGVYHWDF